MKACFTFLLALITFSSLAQEIKQLNGNVDEYVEEVFTIVEEPAGYPGGINAFYKFLQKEMKYPAQAKKKRIQGWVFLQFVVEKDGSLTDVKLIKGIGGGCDEEAIRMFETSPKWTPATINGKPVRQKMTQNILFKLTD